ncbi:DctP family TRAP transporter solute-binding subunit [Bacillus sp. AFS040349]|uniref:DctP family TRAP transporter solute-binding subunit n=1 Tax=Bacillus sp. AFS040349 TaxID=2033502 RepID=UPI000BFE1D24|nr:DctP family TRAP transporter solute-binding subunit [Bacillus sp. AFS040349]PGT81361.1 C4-dicarboxylate ABC transporter [Bacillus sp. AFS040349]
MKYLIGSCLVVLGLIFSLIFYPFQNADHDVSYDDEQEGLSEQIVIKFSHVVAENTPKGLAAQRFAQLAAEKTNGIVKVEVVPNGALYTDEQELEALENNNVQMIAPSLSKMTKLTPEWGLFDLPFLFENDEDVEEIFSGQISERLLTLHTKENIKGMALWSNGFKQMTSNVHALQIPGDFQGQRFRTMPSSIIEEQFQQLGARPISIPFDQLYTSLEQDMFDGQENTISNIYSRRLYEFQTNMTISNHGFLGYVVLINQNFWNSLPKDIQEGLTSAMKETTEWMLNESVKMNIEQLKLMKDESTIDIHVLTSEERAEWVEKLMPVYKSYQQGINDELIKNYIMTRIEELETPL